MAGPQPTQFGRSIRIFLVDGSPSGLIIAEIVNWTGKAIVVPRSALPSFLARAEATNAGVYILSGFDPEEPLRSMIYVGETENVGARLRTHDGDPSKDFFERAIVFVSKDENLTKGHARHLESRLVEKMRDADRAKLMNGNDPGLSPLPEADRSDMEYFISQLELLLPVLGLDILRLQDTQANYKSSTAHDDDKIVGMMPSPIFVFTEAGTNAKAQEINNEFIIKANSLARERETPTIPERAKLLRRQYREDGTLVPSGDNLTLRFTRDVALGSPSGAAQIVYGGSNNGRYFWKIEGTSKSYGDWREEMLSATDGQKD